MSEVHLILHDASRLNSITHYLCLGKYLSAIEVFGRVYSFHPPGQISYETSDSKSTTNIRKRLLLGQTRLTRIDVLRAIKHLSNAYEQNYDDLTHNCDHFSNAFLKALLGKSIPDWVWLSDDLLRML